MEIEEAKRIIADGDDEDAFYREAIFTIVDHAEALEADLQAKGERVAMLERLIINKATNIVGSGHNCGCYFCNFARTQAEVMLALIVRKESDCLDALDNMNAGKERNDAN